MIEIKILAESEINKITFTEGKGHTLLWIYMNFLLYSLYTEEWLFFSYSITRK